MGMEMSMWFVLYGANCLRKPRSPSRRKVVRQAARGVPPQAGNRPALQRVVCGLNHDGASHLPCRSSTMAASAEDLRHIMRRKAWRNWKT